MQVCCVGLCWIVLVFDLFGLECCWCCGWLKLTFLKPDLFWGLRGGGGNFGVVVTFKFKLHEVGVKGKIALEIVDFAPSDARKALQIYSEWAMTAPRSITAFPFFNDIYSIFFVCNGPQEDLTASIAPFKELVSRSYVLRHHLTHRSMALTAPRSITVPLHTMTQRAVHPVCSLCTDGVGANCACCACCASCVLYGGP